MNAARLTNVPPYERRWLGAHHDDDVGVWLILAKKGTTEPTTLTYDQALEEALCHGWIDGQRRTAIAALAESIEGGS